MDDLELSPFEAAVVARAHSCSNYQPGDPPVRCEILLHERGTNQTHTDTFILVKYWVCDPDYLYYWKSKDAYEQVVYPTITAAYQLARERTSIVDLDECWIPHMLLDSYLPLLQAFERTLGQSYDLSQPFVMGMGLYMENEYDDDGKICDGSGGEHHWTLMPPTNRSEWLGLLAYTKGKFKL